MNDHPQQITRLLQPVPLVAHLRQSNLKISFQQGKSLHVFDQVEGHLGLLIGQAQLSRPHRRQREPLPDPDAGIAGGRPAHPLFDLEQPWQKLRPLASDRIVDGEAAPEWDRLPDRLLVVVQRLLYHLLHATQPLKIPACCRFDHGHKPAEQAQTKLEQGMFSGVGLPIDVACICTCG